MFLAPARKTALNLPLPNSSKCSPEGDKLHLLSEYLLGTTTRAQEGLRALSEASPRHREQPSLPLHQLPACPGRSPRVSEAKCCPRLCLGDPRLDSSGCAGHWSDLGGPCSALVPTALPGPLSPAWELTLRVVGHGPMFRGSTQLTLCRTPDGLGWLCPRSASILGAASPRAGATGWDSWSQREPLSHW